MTRRKEQKAYVKSTKRRWPRRGSSDSPYHLCWEVDNDGLEIEIDIDKRARIDRVYIIRPMDDSDLPDDDVDWDETTGRLADVIVTSMSGAEWLTVTGAIEKTTRLLAAQYRRARKRAYYMIILDADGNELTEYREREILPAFLAIKTHAWRNKDEKTFRAYGTSTRSFEHALDLGKRARDRAEQNKKKEAR